MLGQAYTISTFAGGGLPVNAPGTSASVNGPLAVAADQSGNIFFTSQNIILRLEAQTGLLTVVAGTGIAGFSGDGGPATSANLDSPGGLALDAAGSLYIADTNNNRIREVVNGVITTVAGTGVNGFSGDNGLATAANLSQPIGVAVDAAGGVFFSDNRRIRKISNGLITTVVDLFPCSSNSAICAGLGGPQGLAVDSGGNLYIADTHGRVDKVANGKISIVAGGAPSTPVTANSPIGDGQPGGGAWLSYPSGVAVDSAGNVYIADTYDNRVRVVSNGIISTVSGAGPIGALSGSFGGDGGPATNAQMNWPSGVAIDPAGTLYVADQKNNRIRKVSSGVITTVAGNGATSFAGDGGPAIGAQMNQPYGVAVDAADNLYVADSYNNRIRKVSSGVITTVAGNGSQGFSGDGSSATAAELSKPFGVAVDSAGEVYIADTFNYRVRSVSNGVITTVAGNGTFGFSGDGGTSTNAQLSYPYGVATGSTGDAYIADNENNRIRKVSQGVITTVAGNGLQNFGSNNVSATSTPLDLPSGVAVDSAGNFYIADYGSDSIREVSNGIITTVAGGGFSGLGDNGPATAAQLSSPSGVAVDRDGNLYIADTFNNRVRKVTKGVITTVAGNGTAGLGGDGGPAINAQLNLPSSVAVDSAGNIYVADTGNSRVRVLRPRGPVPTPAITEVDNGFSNIPGSPIASGSWVVIKGANLSSTNPGRGWNANESFPATMDATSVSINGKPAFLYYISPTQVNVQAPTDGTLGPVSVVVTNNGAVSAAFVAQYQTSAPALLQWGGGQYPYALISRGSDFVGNPAVISNSLSAHAGDVLTLWATGLGATNPLVPAGQQPSTFPGVTTTPTVTIGGNSVTVTGAILRYAGLYQVNIQLPRSLPSGDLPIQVSQGAFQSPSGVLIDVQ